MNQNLKKRQNDAALDARAEGAWKRIRANKSDEQEDTFCYMLFEQCQFDEKLFVDLCHDMNLAIENSSESKPSYDVLIWIITCICQCIFSHYDKNDLYKIKNFDDHLSSRWNGEYYNNLRSLQEKLFAILNKDT